MKPAHPPDKKETPQTWPVGGVDRAETAKQTKRDDTPQSWRWQQATKPELVKYVTEHRRTHPLEPLPENVQREMGHDWRIAVAC